MRQWTEEDRQNAALRAKLYRPWLSSTGPRSLIGKATSARNSYKHGRYTYERQLIRWYIRLAAHRNKQIRAHLNVENHKRENELIAKYGLRPKYQPKPLTFHPYMFGQPIKMRRKGVRTPRKKSESQEIYDLLTIRSED